LGFRASLELSTAHDDLLHVDVSKQRLEMDDEIHGHLLSLMKSPKQQADAMFEKCRDLLKRGQPEGVGFEQTVDVVPEDDPAEEVSPPDVATRNSRAKKKEDESAQISQQTKDADPPVGGAAGEPKSEQGFVKIRYSDQVPGTNLWVSQKHPVHGVYVTINRRHNFYQTILAGWGEASPERLACEALIFCCAVAEVKTFENLTNVDDNVLKRVLERYMTVSSYNLNEWAAGNQHLFDSK
jgi:hypothetical protein